MNNTIIIQYDANYKNRKITLGHKDWGTYILEQAEHFWPQYSNEDRIVPLITDVTSAVGCTKW